MSEPLSPGRGVGERLLVRGIARSARDPLGEIPAKQMQTPVKPDALQGFCFLPVLHQASLVRPCRKQNHPGDRRDGLHLLCGERGIRTPGPTIAGQRFSRPPHSTTLPSLQILLSCSLAVPAKAVSSLRFDLQYCSPACSDNRLTKIANIYYGIKISSKEVINMIINISE